MKNPAQIIAWLEEQIENYEFALDSSPDDTDLKKKRQGALDMALQTKRFIEDDKWKM